MKRISLLHITDLHFSSSGTGSAAICRRVQSFSAGLLQSLALNDCRARFLEDVPTILRRSNIKLDGIICTGDIGTGKERLVTLPSGINYIGRLADKFSISHENVLIAPGNHDLDRDEPGHELDLFFEKCKEKEFSYPQSSDPKKMVIKDIPIFALNSCVGGTEQSFYGIAKEKWNKALKNCKLGSLKTIVKKNPHLKYQFEEMDIPVLGMPQLDKFSSLLSEASSSFALVAMHHNPLPTNNVELRPFANLVDSGILIQKLVTSNKDVIILHGHTHCESALTIYQHGNGSNQNKLIAALGHHGLSDGEKSLAAVIDLFFNDSGLFIKANVIHIALNGSCYREDQCFSLKSFNCRVDLDINWNEFEKMIKYPFPDFAAKIARPADERLAETLLMVDSDYIDITNKDANFKDWQICRII